MANYYTSSEFDEIEQEAIAHAATARRLREAIEKAESVLNDNADDDGGLSEEVRIKAVSILSESLRRNQV